MRESDFIFDSVQLMYYNCHEVNFKSGGSYIHISPDRTKKATISSKNKDDKSFQYAATVAFNYEEIKQNIERVSNVNRL